MVDVYCIDGVINTLSMCLSQEGAQQVGKQLRLQLQPVLHVGHAASHIRKQCMAVCGDAWQCVAMHGKHVLLITH